MINLYRIQPRQIITQLLGPPDCHIPPTHTPNWSQSVNELSNPYETVRSFSVSSRHFLYSGITSSASKGVTK